MFEKVIIGDATLLRCDCMEYLATLPDKAFDLAIVDPPYAVGASDGSFGRGGARAKNSFYRKDLKHYANSNLAPNGGYFAELFRVSTNQIIWGANYYPQHLKHSGWIVWDKDKKDGILSQAELAYQSLDKVVKIFKHEWEGFRKGGGSFEQTSTQTIHPNQKPVKLYEWLLTNYAKPGQRILDTHLGSGSSAIAALGMGFEFVGCELDKDYFASAVQRIENAQRQTRMFEPHNQVQADLMLEQSSVVTIKVAPGRE